MKFVKKTPLFPLMEPPIVISALIFFLLMIQIQGYPAVKGIYTSMKR